MIRFIICKDDCRYKNGMPGFVSQGYYPSSPKRPEFAIATHIFLVFHLIHMKGPSSKQGFCTALQTYFEMQKGAHENGCEALDQLLDMLTSGPFKHLQQFPWSISSLGKGSIDTQGYIQSSHATQQNSHT